MEEERLSQRDAVDGVVQIIALVQLHLMERAEGVGGGGGYMTAEEKPEWEAEASPADPPTAWPGALETSGCSRSGRTD